LNWTSRILKISVGRFFIKKNVRSAYEKINKNEEINYLYSYLLNNYDYYLKKFTKNDVLKNESLFLFYNLNIYKNKYCDQYTIKNNDKKNIIFLGPMCDPKHLFLSNKELVSTLLSNIKQLCDIFKISFDEFKNLSKIKQAFEKIGKTEEFKNDKYDFFNLCYFFILSNHNKYLIFLKYDKTYEKYQEPKTEKILYKTKKITYKNKEYIMNSYKNNKKITFIKWIYDSFDLPENSELKDFKKAYYSKMKKNHPDKINSPKKKKIGEDNTKFYNALYDFVIESFE